jgi:hypothetical protein
MNEQETYHMLKGLAGYLKSSIEVSEGDFESSVLRGQTRELIKRAGKNIKVVIQNTAPVENTLPAIVFTGVGLSVKFPSRVQRSITRMTHEGSFRVNPDDNPRNRTNPFNVGGVGRVDSEEFPLVTPDEAEQGHLLLLEDSLTYEINLTSEECPDIKDMKFIVEGNISRRHLFHCIKELMP